MRKEWPTDWSTGTLFITIFVVVLYCFIALCMRRIAENLGVKPSWYAWVPVLNIYLWCKICGKGLLWTVLMFIPIVNIIFFIILSFKLARVCGRGRLYGFFLLITPVNIVLMWLLAFSKKSLSGDAVNKAVPEPGASGA